MLDSPLVFVCFHLRLGRNLHSGRLVSEGVCLKSKELLEKHVRRFSSQI